MSNEVTIKTEDELKAKFQEMAHILHNLRFYTKYWKEHHGFYARREKEKWELRADKLLDDLGLTEHNNSNAVKVTRE